MRELEFLPDWYPQIRSRRRVVVIQAWTSLAIVLGLGVWWTVSSRNVRAAESTLASLDAQLVASRGEVKTLEELVTLQKKLGAQAQVLAKVGTHVESARLLATLDEVMPKTMALLELSFQTEELKPASLADTRVAQEKDRKLDRRLNVKLAGVAPTDVEVADFLTKLTAKAFFEDVRMTRSKPRLDNGRLMREFEVYFSMNLNDPAGT